MWIIGFDIIKGSMNHAKKSTTYYGWRDKCEKVGYTFEMTLLLNRIIFTADPENMKALLTTQFTDFGKLLICQCLPPQGTGLIDAELQERARNSIKIGMRS